ncbi:hypothetical protein D3C73_1066210 [compost metagenome]
MGPAQEPEELQLFFNARLWVLQGVPTGDEEQVFPNSEGRKEEIIIEDSGDLPAERYGVRIDEETMDLHVSCQRGLPSSDGPGYRGLSCSVHAHNSQDFTRVHRRRNFAADRSPGIPNQQAFGLQNCPHGATLPAGLAPPHCSV